MFSPVLRRGPEIAFAAALIALWTPGFDRQIAGWVPVLLPILTFLSLLLLPRQSGEARFIWWQPLVLTIWGQGLLPWVLVGGLALAGVPRDWLLIALLLNSAGSVYLVTNFAILLDRRPRLMLTLLVSGLVATPLFLFLNASLFFASWVAIDLAGFAKATTLFLALPMAAAWGARRLGLAERGRSGWQLASLAVVTLIAFGLEAEVSAALHHGLAQRDWGQIAHIGRALTFVVGLALAAFFVSRTVLRQVGLQLKGAAGLVALGHAVRNAAMVFVLVEAYLPDSYGLVLGVVQIPIYFAPLALRRLRS